MKNLKKVLLAALTISSSITYGQIYTPGAVIAGPSGSTFVGIGLSTPTSKLHVFDLSSTGSVDFRTNYLFFGTGNIITSSSLSGTFGNSNLIDESKMCFDFGDKNRILSSGTSFISGTANNIIASYNTSVFGHNNQFEKNIASGGMGEENTVINSKRSTAFGYMNTIQSSTSVSATGQSNVITESDESVALGEDNKVINGCHGCAAIGGHNTVDALGGSKYLFALGAGLTNNIPGSVMIGTNGPTVFVAPNNRVGIAGNTTPAEALDVIGSIQSSDLAPGGQVCADANGKLYISGACGSGGGSDNLGNHAATMNLNMNCFEIDKPSNINFCNGIVFDEATVPGELIIQGGPLGIGVSPSSVGTSPLGSTAMLAVGGSIWASGFWYTSDERFKTNIKTLPNALETIKQFNGYSYEYLTEQFPDYKFQEGETYGFLAQEVEKISPSLVQQGENGYFSVNYLGVIPILTEAIKEQQTILDQKNEQIENLSDQMTNLERELSLIRDEMSTICTNGCGTTTPSGNNGSNSGMAKLDTNVPNPFSGQTTIGYFVPATAGNAYISITDLNGRELELHQLTNFGSNDQLVISVNDKLVSGIYLYNLIIDNELIDSKKMVISSH